MWKQSTFASDFVQGYCYFFFPKHKFWIRLDLATLVLVQGCFEPATYPHGHWAGFYRSRKLHLHHLKCSHHPSWALVTTAHPWHGSWWHSHPSSQLISSAVHPMRVTTKGSACIYLAFFCFFFFLSALFCPFDQNLALVQAKHEPSSPFPSIQTNVRIWSWCQNKDFQLTIHLGISMHCLKKDPQRNSSAESFTSEGPQI